jgi:isoamylase
MFQLKNQITTSNGTPYYYGVKEVKNGLNFAIYAPNVEWIILSIFLKNNKKAEFELSLNVTGQVWHLHVEGLPSTFRYGYLVKNKGSSPIFCFDPYSLELNSSRKWGGGSPESLILSKLNSPIQGYTGVYNKKEEFDWEGIRAPGYALKDLIIYEMHVRSFTQSRSSKVNNPGTFLGIIEKIPYLKELGINAIELLPCFEFNESEYQKNNEISGDPLYNYWGYSTMNFFSPMNRYVVGESAGSGKREFQLLVKELHRNGIEVILDVVYNHTFEGNKSGPNFCYKTLGKETYYLIDEQLNFSNYSGCGNSVNANHPVTRQWILDSLRYWVTEMKVDGFRFDLGSLLTRSRKGVPLSEPPVIEEISEDPILLNTKLITEPWDAAGLYQVGKFPYKGRWSEWNGKYRDSVRRFMIGNSEERGIFATRWCGSQDLYGGYFPYNSLNFVTAHDGFSLYDLFSYNDKHNIENGENNRDGSNDNESWNCGEEGVTENVEINNLRRSIHKSTLITLMTSQGVPMLLMGDEYGHTKSGNNNTWCLDNEKNWFDWNLLEERAGLFRFFKKVIELRNRFEIFRTAHFFQKDEVSWYNSKGEKVQWDQEKSFLGILLPGFYLAFNIKNEEIKITLPKEGKWQQLVDTDLPSPYNFLDYNNLKPIALPYVLNPHSILIAILD